MEQEITNAFVEAISSFFAALFGIGFIIWIIGLLFALGFVALIVLVVKKIWYWEPKKNKKVCYSWYEEAHERQNKRYEYTDPIKPAKDTRKGEEPKWYPSGWVFNEETQLWDPPDYLKIESKKKWEWDTEKGIWIDIEKQARMERYRKAHEGREPTFEEWKAAREKKLLEEQQHPKE